MTDRGIGDNGGPPLQKFTAKHKLDRIREVLDMDITAQQKCVGVGIIVEADADGIAAELSTKRLQTFASVSDRETVYRATKVLKQESVAEAIKVKGKPNSYRVLPSKVIDSIVDAYNQSKVDHAELAWGSPVEPDMGSPVKPDGSSGSPSRLPPDMGVSPNPTSGSNHVGSNPACRSEPDMSGPDSLACARGVDNNIINNNNNPREREDRGYGGKEILVEEDDQDQRPTPKIALEAFELYNAMALRVGLPQARTLTPQRRKNAMARMREHGGIEAFKIALANIERSAFLQGQNDRGWVADFDFLVQASRFTKVVEGTYGNGAHALEKAGGPKKSDEERLRELLKDEVTEGKPTWTR